MSGGQLFGRDEWDPWRITSQIAAVQALYYLSLAILYKLVVAPYVPDQQLAALFDWRGAGFRSFHGWMVSVATGVNAVLAAFYLRFIVQRAKKCLDFSGTILLLHLVVVTCISGFPRSAAWWVLHGTNVAITALLGEWLCMQKELQEIPLASLRRSRAAAGSSGAATATAARANGGASSSGSSSGGGAIAANGGSGGAGGLALTSLTTRASTANIMELGKVDHSADRSFSKEWAPLSPVDATKSQLPPPPPR